MNKPPLEGIKVVEFGMVWVGPYMTMLLGFLGAEVIKVESVKSSDPARTIGQTGGLPGFDGNSFFNEMNLGKLGIRLNLKQPKAVELAKKIISMSDIVIENMRPGVMDRLGIGYATLKEVKSDLIMLSASTAGSTGPEREYTGYAATFSALGGLSQITGYPDSRPWLILHASDLRIATTGAFAVLAALNYRARTGEGQHIDLSNQEAIAVLSGDKIMDYTMNGRVGSRMGNYDEVMVPHNCYPCKDDNEWVTIAVSSEEEWAAFCKATGAVEWPENIRFTDAYARRKNQDEIDSLIQKWTRKHSAHEIMNILQEVGVAAMPTYDSEGLFKDPHLKERRFSAEIHHPELGKKIVIAPQWKLSATPAKIPRPAPLLGEHNEYVFGEYLGMSKAEIAKLEEEKIIY